MSWKPHSEKTHVTARCSGVLPSCSPLASIGLSSCSTANTILLKYRQDSFSHLFQLHLHLTISFCFSLSLGSPCFGLVTDDDSPHHTRSQVSSAPSIIYVRVRRLQTEHFGILLVGHLCQCQLPLCAGGARQVNTASPAFHKLQGQPKFDHYL